MAAMRGVARTARSVGAAALTALWVACSSPPAHDMKEVASIAGPEGTTEVVLVAQGSEWRYHDGGMDLGDGWRIVPWVPEWSQGVAPLGYGESYVATTVSYGDDPSNKHPTIYYRTAFNVEDPSRVTKLYLRSMFDDGFVFYLNGKEAGRAWMPWTDIDYETLSSGHETGNNYMTFDVSAQIPDLLAGGNSLAVEVHQVTPYSSDTTMDFALIAVVDDGDGDGEEGPPFVATSNGVPGGSVWKFWDSGTTPGDAWNQVDYDDNSWSTGRAPLGFGEPYIEDTTSPGVITTYFRHEFTVDTPIVGMDFMARFDDGYVAYLNGVEIHRSTSVPSPSDETTTASDREATSGFLRRGDESRHLRLLRDGVNVLAVEVHQSSASSDDLVWDGALELIQGDGWQAFDMPLVDGVPTQDIDFLDSNRGFAIAQFGVMATSDGGRSWERVSDQLGLDIEVLDGPDGQVWGWTSWGSAYNTRDGGLTWAESSPPEPVEALGVLSPYTILASTPRPDLNGYTPVYESNDGGTSWTAVAASTSLDGEGITAFEALDSDTAIAADNSSVYRVSRHATGTWSFEELFDGTTDPESYVSIEVEDIAVQQTPAGSEIFVCGNFENHVSTAMMLRSSDGGASWLDVSPTTLPFIDDCGFGDDGLGAMVAGASLYITEDWGTTWMATHPDSRTRLNALDIVGHEVFVAGQDGVMLYTDCAHCQLGQSLPSRTAPACSTAPVASWSGVAEVDDLNPRGDTIDAQVTWMLDRSEGCVDHYTPTGTLSRSGVFTSPCETELDASFGTMAVDRSTQPWTFEVSGVMPNDTTCGFPGLVWTDGDGASVGDFVRGITGTEDTLAFCSAEETSVCFFRFEFAAD